MQSDDTSLAGQHTLTLVAYLIEYPSMRNSQVITIIFEGKCENIDNVVASDQLNAEYSYTGILRHELIPFTTDPEGCGPISYSCAVTTGDRLDICDLDGVSSFDTQTGMLQISLEDKSTIIPGSYTFEITGTFDDKSTVTTF